MHRKLIALAAGVLAVGAMATTLTLTTSNAAQEKTSAAAQQPGRSAPPPVGPSQGGPQGPPQGGPGPGQGFGGQGGMPPGGMMGGPMMGGGNAVMVADADYLYILRGNMIYKVRKSNLEVAVQNSLPMQMGGGPGGNGRDGGNGGNGGGRFGGGGGVGGGGGTNTPK